jgi:hypothetical protein
MGNEPMNPANMMELTKSLLWSLPLSLLSHLGSVALATTIELNLLPHLESTGTCPETLIAHQTPRPYTEGGYATDGMIKLREIATDIRLLEATPFSATWVGTLKPEYRDCQAAAIINRIDGDLFAGQSFLTVQLFEGEAVVRLDRAGIADANGYNTIMIFQGMREGNPRWAWGGTD